MHSDRAGDDEQLFLCGETAGSWSRTMATITFLLHSALRRWASAWGVTDIYAGILILPYGLGEWEQARTLDIFVASAVPITNAYFEWRAAGSWVGV